MSGGIRESDWKKLRTLAPVAMGRAFDRAIERMRTILSTNLMSQKKFWDIKNYADERRPQLARMFDGMRRSDAIERLATLWVENLLTDEELKSFSPETLEMAKQLKEFYER